MKLTNIISRSAPEVLRSIDMLKEKYAGKKLIVARDKLDYVKGVRQKMLAFEQFLIRHPEWRGKVRKRRRRKQFTYAGILSQEHQQQQLLLPLLLKVVLIQIALSTAEGNELRAHISDVVARVNSKFSNISYQPIVFLHQDISFSQYLALLTAADVSLITPLRDGMNLTSHEYIVCQENNYGPLILSEASGAAAALFEKKKNVKFTLVHNLYSSRAPMEASALACVSIRGIFEYVLHTHGRDICHGTF